MRKKLPIIIALVGPTATGKSDLGVLFARKYNGEVISADSRQVYKGFDKGSGKITKKEMWGVRHHMLDVRDPRRPLSVSEYQKLGHKKIHHILKQKRLPIIVGGSGMYVDALIKNPAFPEVPPNKKLRKTLEALSLPLLVDTLRALDAKALKRIDSKNPRRLIRAIEIATALGSIPKIKERPLYSPIFIGIDASDGVLKKRIHTRLYARMKKGMVHEVTKLHLKGVSWKTLESYGLEYKYISLFLQKKMSKKEMLEKLEREIWKYAKRQRTWFRKNKDIQWFDIKNKKNIFSFIEKKK